MPSFSCIATTTLIHSFMDNKKNKPLHVVMFPWIAMGHMYPCFEVSKILAQNGHFVTLISTPSIIDRLPKLSQTLSPFVNLIKLPLSSYIDKNHLPTNADSTMDIPSNKLYYLKLAYDCLQESVAEILKTSNPDWVFYDFAACWLPQLAKGLNLNISCCYFSPCPAWSICFFDTPKKQLGDVESMRTNAEDYYGPPKWIYFQTKIGLRPYEVRKLLEDIEVNETGASPVFDLNRANSDCDMFVIRSSRDLEGEWLDFLGEFYNKPVIPVGLLPPRRDCSSDEVDNSPDWIQIKAWLDTQKGSSVVYIAFGSEVKLSQENLNELALGIENSKLPFFWVLRDLKNGFVELPNGFEDRTKDHGIVWKSWAPQAKILGHGSVGGCLTHCGSGSMIENLYFGHVLVMLPFLLDQALYSRVMQEKKVGIEIVRNEEDGSFTRNSVAKALRFTMVDEEGSDYRKNAKEIGKKFSNKEVHNQYVENFLSSLQNHSFFTSKS